ncbi:MAG: alpha/beta hydrolase [Polyangiaceae bacterium]
MTIQHDEGEVRGRSVPGPALYYRHALPEGTPKAMVALLHGYADHGGRYTHVMDAWAERGIGVVALDMRGHGKAEGVRGHCLAWDEFLDDSAELERLATERAKGAPMFLCGHSFGGLVSLKTILDRKTPYRGLVLSSPYVGLAMEVPAVKVLAAKIASRVAPALGIPSGLSGAQCTGDPVRAKAYDEDPLGFKTARARWFVETQRVQAEVIRRAGELTLPLRITFGGSDPIAKLSAAKEVFDRASSKDKTWDERPGLLHEPLSERVWADVAKDMGDWILGHAS